MDNDILNALYIKYTNEINILYSEIVNAENALKELKRKKDRISVIKDGLNAMMAHNDANS